MFTDWHLFKKGYQRKITTFMGRWIKYSVWINPEALLPVSPRLCLKRSVLICINAIQQSS
ncbi:hypothetical protein FQO02_12530 [Salmonella enterica]|uniref:Uncharacterized protein n=2 Tax=Salmonella enterica TaxID=28901 RepID=A0A5U2TH04_SALER|nr:hypothetical protein [Salmonella enterica]EDQ3386544.1 hypothetical protein [Salmonella enterica subsp. houtenae]EDR6668800.1 hypothetical protein [Salmonella enterica subsp. enterica]EDX4410261.1 hypothetical protein [Salmonella enterica subsp. houtenae serovar 44:z36,[z38]:-]HAE8235296.1 hypothetical protein [Salmonella enterica subsp. houtenae serovar 44:z36[z38]:-]